MTENGQITYQKKKQVSTKRGMPIYSSNPSIPAETEIRKNKRAQFGNDTQGMVVDNGTGEILGQGGAMVYKWEEVDKTRFVKLYLDGIKQAAGLSKAGLAVFEMVYNQVRNNPGKDEIQLSYLQTKIAGIDLSDRTYRRGVHELLQREFLYRSPIEGIFFVNIRFMFNGDRLAFVKGYKLKGADARQAELPLEEAQKTAAE